MPDFLVSTFFTARDKFTNVFNRMGKGAKKFGNDANAAFLRASKSGSKFKGITKGILAASAVQRGLGLVQQGIRGITTEFFEFDDAITGAAARFKDIGPLAEDFNEQMRVLKSRARLAGATTEQTATQAAVALDFLARAGFTSAEAMGALDSMINLATASGEEFATVADFSSDLLGAFFGQIDNTAEKIAKLNRLNDVLVKSANSANVTIESQFETMKFAAPIARKYGAELEEVAALTAILGNSGIKGSLGATALKNSFVRLAAPTKEVEKGLASLGLSQADLVDKSGKMKKVTDILDLLTKRIDKLGFKGKQQELGVFSSIFGLRAAAGAATLADSIRGIREFEQTLKNAAGTSEATADRMRGSLGNRLKTLQSAAVDLGFGFLDTFEGKIKGGLDKATESFRKFDVKPLVEGVKTLISGVKTLVAIFSFLKPILPVIIGGMIAYGVAMRTIQLFQFIKMVRAATAAQGLFNVVMSANPVGLIIIGIAALIAGIILVVKHWDKMKFAFMVVINVIKKAFFSFVDFFLSLWGTVIKAIVSAASKFGKLLGFDTSGLDKVVSTIDKIQKEVKIRAEASVIPPNKEEVRAQASQFNGRLDIAGAPEGSTVTTESGGAFGLDVVLLGANH
ncbi:MAG: phage tail tape measure protein [candidate division Zixibacteria bacterium]|nr:phage tail tape measure protein [candidate division Zixibacteria bacterium]